MAARTVASRTRPRPTERAALRHLMALPPLRIAAQAGQTIASMLPVIGGDIDMWGQKLNQLAGAAVYIVSGVTPDAYGNVDLSAVYDALGAATAAKTQAIAAAALDATTKAAAALSSAQTFATGAANAAQTAAAADATSKVNALGSSLPGIYPSLDGNSRLAIGGAELTPAAIGAPPLPPSGTTPGYLASVGSDGKSVVYTAPATAGYDGGQVA